jgi:small-conductance mechanosensitive channel
MTARSLPRLLAALFAALVWLGCPAASRGQDGAGAPSGSAAAPVRRPSPPASPLDVSRPRSTPRRALASFLRLAQEGDFDKAAEHLDLRGVPRTRDKREAAELAAMLYRVLEWHVEISPEALPDEPSPAGLERDGVVLDVIELGGEEHALALVPVLAADGSTVWKFSRATVQAVRPIYEANERRFIEDGVPSWLKARRSLALFPWQWLGLAVLAALAYVTGSILGAGLVAIMIRVARSLEGPAADVVGSLGRPIRLALATGVFQLGARYLLLPATAERLVSTAATVLYIVSAAWGAIALVRLATSTWERKLPEDTLGELESRGLRTRLTMLGRIASGVIGVVAAGVALLQFDVVRSVGVSLLASAGILGVLVGIAAQRSLGGVIAGIEMSITQPVRIGDIVEFDPGKLGTVEEIYFTYVVVRLLDDRRQIVPVTRVMASPFENWTRTSVSLTPFVDIFVDHATPIGLLRDAWREACRQSGRWDERVARVDVVDVTDRAVRVRGVASVGVATEAYALACELRESWLAFVQQLDGGRFLPHGRVVPPPPAASEAETSDEAAPASSERKS